MIQTKRPGFSYNKYQVTFQVGFTILLCIVQFYKQHLIAVQNPTKVSQSYLGMRDSHDFQWEAFRSNLGLMVCIALGWRLLGSRRYPSIIGFVIILIMFRADVILYMGVVTLSYLFSVAFYRYKRFQLFKWVFLIGTIATSEYCSRFKSTSQWIQKFVFVDWFKNSNHVVHWGSLLNMSLLKMLSFGVDIHRNHFGKQNLQRHYDKCQQCRPNSPCLKARDSFPSYPPTYLNYLNYILFPGTLFAGPPITYNSFHSFKSVKMDCENPTLKLVRMLVFFQLFQVYLPQTDIHSGMSLVQMQITCLANLTFIWCKFMIIWRWAKVWSYLEQVEVVENMNRCILNNYGFEGFWRMWHRGFNIWLVRYLYIPLGGSKSLIKSYLCVFLFVAFWHDPELKLALWALIILPFIIPEIVVKKIARQKFMHLYPKFWFKALAAITSAVYIYAMCLANIIGFGFGTQGASIVLLKMQTEWPSMIVSMLAVSIVVMVMFYIRSRQKVDYGY